MEEEEKFNYSKYRAHRYNIGREVSDHMEQFSKQSAGMQQQPAPEEAQQPQQEENETTRRPETEASVAVSALEDETRESAPWQPFTIVTRTDVGKVRANNEDSVIECGRLCGVADGMGGHQAGETASAAARDGLIAQLRDKEPDPVLLQKAVKAVNRRIFIRAQEDEKLRGMGTTVSVIWLGDVQAYIAHVGDSRVYRLQDGEFKQITDDHSLVGELVRAGVITEEQALSHPMRNVITRAVGTEGGVDVDLLSVVRKPGDVWLICSDGLYDMVSNDKMAEILREHPVEEAADLLLQAALDAGGSDNVSIVLLQDREGAQ